MIADRGIPAWYGAGGVMQADGRLSFGPTFESRSGNRSQVVRFTPADSAGSTIGEQAGWLSPRSPILMTRIGELSPSAGPARRGCWIPWPGVERFEPERLNWHSAIVWGVHGRRSDRAAYAARVWLLRRLQLLDIVMHILADLCDQPGDVEFTAVDLKELAASSVTDDPAPTADELWDALCIASQLQIAELRLGPCGWDPRVIQQSAVVTDVERVDLQTFGLHLSPLWSQAITTLFQRTCEPDAEGNSVHSWSA